LREKISKPAIFLAVILVLAISIPLQYLVRRDVVVGLAPGSAHSHAHSEGEDGHQHTEEEHQAAEVKLGENLISNYGFEAGTREQIWGWTAMGTGQGEAIYRDLDVARSGMASAAISTNGNLVQGAKWVMRMDELPLGHEVVAEGYIRTESLAGAAYLSILLETTEEDGEKPVALDWAFSDAVAEDSDWTRVNVRIYVPPEATGVWFEAGLQGSGRAWFDDVSLLVEEAE
jgi:hypothetical protein